MIVMGHRHLYSISQMFGSEHEQNWNYMHPDQYNVLPGKVINSICFSCTPILIYYQFCMVIIVLFA